jgi:cyclopropane fatty-acyl-phospholipid synthase-like methyltransferase
MMIPGSPGPGRRESSLRMSGEYDQYLSKYYSQDTARLERNAAMVLDHHGSHFPADKDAAILEIGPGTGALLGLLHNRCGYRNVKGVDISAEVAGACNTVLPGSTSLVDDTEAYLHEREQTFDLVLMLHTLEHIPKDQVLRLLRATYSALKVGGKLVVEVPNCEHPIVGTRNRYVDFTHTLGFTDLSLKFVMQNSGFSQVSIYGCKVPRKNLGRVVQRAAQDTVEFFLSLAVRLYRPGDPLILASILGACATK